MDTLKRVGRLALLLLVVAIAIKLVNTGNEDKPSKAAGSDAVLSAMPEGDAAYASQVPKQPRISDKAIIPITKDAWPETYKKWGKAGVDKINSLMKPAAELIAASPDCDAVDYISLSGDRSAPGKNIVFFADCANRKRLYISEQEINEKAIVVSQDRKSAAISDTDFLAACYRAIRNRLNFPSSFDPGWFGSSVYRAQAGKAVATVQFDAMNAMGAKLPHVGKCYMDGGVLTDVEISRR